MMSTLNEAVKSFAAVWGDDYVDELLDQGFTPTLVTDGNAVKLVWLQTLLTNG